ncbi:MAG: response regulator [Eubacteriales bacterium]|nr:response regulator [Eubacteriales bacterium]
MSKKSMIRGQYVLLAFLLTVILLYSLRWMRKASSSLTDTTANQISSLYLRELSSATAKHLQTALEYHFSSIDTAAQMLTEETAADEGEFQAFISRIKEIQGFSFLAFVDEEGYYHDGSGVFSAAGNVSFLGSLLMGKTHLISYNEKIQNDDVILMGARMEPVDAGDTRFIAVLAGLATENMSRKMVLANEQSHTYSSVVTSDGTYVIRSEVKEQFRGSNMLSVLRKSAEASYEDELQEIAQRLRTGGEGTLFVRAKTGETFYLYYTPLENTDWYLATLMPYEVIEGTIRQLGISINEDSLTIFFIFLALLLSLFLLYIRFNSRKQKQLEQAYQVAEQANSAKSVFLSNMSHDIRTPMNAIVGFVTLLGKDADNPDKVREYAKKIANSSQHLLGLLNDVLDMAKIENGKTSLNLSRMRLADLVEDINTIIRPQMRSRHHRFDIRVCHVAHEAVHGDKLRMQQILLNLLSNAVKYTMDGGRIVLELTELPGGAPGYARYRFQVTDNGYGIEPEYLGHIFDTFSREENSVVNRIQGTGLGLAITKNLVDLMGGTIQVESEKGKGSVFTVELELKTEEEPDGRRFWEERSLTPILVVDEEEAVCKNTVWSMERLGVSADYALEGERAVRMAEEGAQEGKPYQIILLDQKVQDGSGLSIAREIRRRISGKGPIVLLTSYDYSEIEDEIQEDVINGFLSKPFFESGLRQKLQEMLEEPDTESQGEGAGVLEGKHILVAEDNELNAEILTDLLEMKGASCDIFENGKLVYEAFERSGEGQYQLVLMDVQMAVMDGYQATRLIRKSSHPQARTIPIIAMTANAFAEDVQNALDSGMTAHMAKPVDMSRLEKILHDIL